jgi:hypothetical protein
MPVRSANGFTALLATIRKLTLSVAKSHRFFEIRKSIPMSNQTSRTAALLLAGLAGTAIVAQSATAADRIYVSNRAVYDDPCDEPGSGCCNSLCRKFKLHCVYCRRACSQRFIALPYTQPDSTIYIGPPMNGGGGSGYACPPQPAPPAPLGPMTGPPAQYGYGMSPAFAPPNSIFIR